jgi:hypothetical protein
MIQIDADLTVALPEVGQAFVFQQGDDCQVVICCSRGVWFTEPQLWPGRTADENLRPTVEAALLTAKQQGEI